MEAGKLLQERGIASRVVSLPSWELFSAQPREYVDSVLPPGTKARVSIEAATPLGWERYVGLDGDIVSWHRQIEFKHAQRMLADTGLIVEGAVVRERQLSG